MTEEEFEEIRDKDHVVLKHIEKGLDDVQKITAETTLENHHVSYCFEKLEDLGLITVEKPDKMVERVIDGQKRVFQHPKEAKLTGKAHRYLEQSEPESMTEYEDLSHREVVERVKTVEDELEELKGSFRLFKKQIQKKI
ncbi:hypothetical protein [Haloferax volcanii]|uniref:Uncharacterized protein n=3 Tax=Haloferax volcanii TaxID=2246 RepID=D4GVZ3_HALVD|nr:hypothetical protein [Haloferax volcanii]ADE02803.1 uncharacterized protein HVO_2277 [Haloferax volcanii DS2]ELY33302.1 hypothetical protein C498_06665 [Haloferax volcanii DS2]MBS8120621.1 hypothetical protein [Haloferax volcanii]MBS8125658.1 hypothetical protein [Haloferax volcanii]MBS8129667.1 hypothetical protein [Haloferax volcanii]